ncbi:MAG: aminopeptidase [Bacteroidota bacterium]
MKSILEKYAHLLVNYCVSLQTGERVLIKAPIEAEPLVREVYREALKAGGIPVTDFDFQGQRRILLEHGEEVQLSYVSPLYAEAMQNYEAYIYIRGISNHSEMAEAKNEKNGILNATHAPYRKRYSERTATLEMKRTLCEYPTLGSAQLAGMAFEDYQDFIFNACNLYADDPRAEWLKVSEKQQKIVDVLNQRSLIRYKSDKIDISFRTDGRKWINSDGQTNMPSGEVYTSPVEDSVNGTIHFDYPVVQMGKYVEGVTLWVEDGEIKKWEAKQGQSVLDHIFHEIEGSRRFGEAAIGTNFNINRFTKNILFDEKIGGTVHMAIGQSYLQCGGKNQSDIHWDMIADMTQGGQIFADDELIYENGKFLFL